MKSSLTNTDHLRPLQQELDELRLRCTTYESTIDHLEIEKTNLLEVIKILSSDDNSNHSTDTSDGNKVSNFTATDNEWTMVSNTKKKKKKPKAINAEVRHQNIPNTNAREPRSYTSNTSHNNANSNSITRHKPLRKLPILRSNESSTYVKERQ